MASLLNRSNDLLDMQLHVTPLRLPLQALQPLLLAPRLRRNLPHDRLLLLRTSLLRILLPHSLASLLPLLNLNPRSPSHLHPPLSGPLGSAFQTFQSCSFPNDGVLWYRTRLAFGLPSQGSSQRAYRPGLRASDGGVVRDGSRFLCEPYTREVEAWCVRCCGT